jgi:CheY-like chemotaxis protein
MRQRTILIVDEGGEITAHALRELHGRGHATAVVPDAISAVLAMRRGGIDLVVLDLCADGARELLALRARDPVLGAIPIVVVTLFADEHADDLGPGCEVMAVPG